MNVTYRPDRPPLSPQEGWISDGRQVLHFQPRRYDRWSQSLEVTLGELIPGEAAPVLKRRKVLTWEQARKLGAQKRRVGRQACPPMWIPPHPDRPASMGVPVITACF